MILVLENRRMYCCHSIVDCFLHDDCAVEAEKYSFDLESIRNLDAANVDCSHVVKMFQTYLHLPFL